MTGCGSPFARSTSTSLGDAAAHRIFRAPLRPLADGEIDLGQDEMPDEVLGVDPADCAARYVVAAYMLAGPEDRAEAVWEATDETRWTGHFLEPLAEFSRVAIEPLPGFEEFFPRCGDLVAEEPEDERRDGAAGETSRWLREVVRRLESADGLGRIARSTRSADDLRTWCRHLVGARDWGPPSAPSRRRRPSSPNRRTTGRTSWTGPPWPHGKSAGRTYPAGWSGPGG